MKNLLKLEELGLFILSIYFIYLMKLDLSWYWYLILFFSPDIGMIGYVINTKIGALTYNLFHHKGIAAGVLILGYTQQDVTFQCVAWILIGHASFDRMLGYGLKYNDDFKHTSLGIL